jgi:hypothetical protein
MESRSKWELAVFDFITMAKTQSVFLSNRIGLAGLAMSSDGKKLAATDSYGGTRLIECHDLTIQKYAIVQKPDNAVAFSRMPVSFEATSRFFAVGCADGRVALRTI